MSDPRLLPPWAEDLRRRYLRGEASMFVLHGNVYDGVIDQQKMRTLTEFLTDVLLKDTQGHDCGLQHRDRRAVREAQAAQPSGWTTCCWRPRRRKSSRRSSAC